MARAVIDASTLVAALLPEEPTKDAARSILTRFVEDEIELVAPTLLNYEVANSLLKAERDRKRRVGSKSIDAMLKELSGLDISLLPVTMEEMVSLARRFDRSSYDASYLALAESEGVPLITADRRLHNATKGRTETVVWVEDYAC